MSGPDVFADQQYLLDLVLVYLRAPEYSAEERTLEKALSNAARRLRYDLDVLTESVVEARNRFRASGIPDSEIELNMCRFVSLPPGRI